MLVRKYSIFSSLLFSRRAVFMKQLHDSFSMVRDICTIQDTKTSCYTGACIHAYAHTCTNTAVTISMYSSLEDCRYKPFALHVNILTHIRTSQMWSQRSRQRMLTNTHTHTHIYIFIHLHTCVYTSQIRSQGSWGRSCWQHRGVERGSVSTEIHANSFHIHTYVHACT